jgi:hypothetical protein
VRNFIERGEQVIALIRGSRSPEDVFGALEWFGSALPRDVGGEEVRRAVAQAQARIVGLGQDAVERGPLRIAAPYELQLIVNRFRRFTLNGNPSGCWSPGEVGGIVKEPRLSNDALSVALACHQGEGRWWDGLPVLADVLEETDSAGADIIAHLRSPGPHVRACWALGAVLRHAGRLAPSPEIARQLSRLFRFHPCGPLARPEAPSL